MRLRDFLLMTLSLMVCLGVTPLYAQTDEEPFTLTASGTIDNDTPFTEYHITVPQDGSTIIADLRAADGNIRFDTLLYLVNDAGQIIAENDDRLGGQTGDLTSRLEYPQALAGDYTIITTRYRVVDGTTQGDYVLDIEIRPPREIALDYQVDEAALIAAGFPILEPHPRATFTILAYYGGDNNLEQALINDLKEFERAGGSDENVRVIVLLDRSAEYSTASGDWSGARIFEVSPSRSGDDALILSSQELVDLGELVDSGDGELFAQFLTWGVKTYPADSYVLAIGSHGVAWRGVVTDDTGDKTLIGLPQIGEALRVTREATGLQRFDLIVNEACYMGSVEYHNVIADYFNYSLASPEVVLNPSHDMTLLTERLRFLSQTGLDFSPDTVEVFIEVTPTADVDSADDADNEVTYIMQNPLLDVFTALADRYIDFDSQTNPGSDVVFTTSAVTDLREFDRVTEAITALAHYVQEDPINRGTPMWQARANAYVYSGYKGRDELVDLGSLMRQLVSVLDPVEDAEYIQRAQDVLTALDASVRYGRGGLVAERSLATYHNIYFPSSSSAFDPAYFETSSLGEWGAMLRALYSGVTPNPWSAGQETFTFHQATAPSLRVVDLFPTGEIGTLRPLTITVEIVGRNISSGNSVVDRIHPDGTVQRLSAGRILRESRDAGGRPVFVNNWEQGAYVEFLTWDAQLPLVTDGTQSNFELVTLTEEVASLEGRYLPPNSERWTNVTLVFDRVNGEFNRAITQDAETNAAAVIEIPEGSIFQAYRYRVTSDGRQVAELGNEYTFHPDLIRWRQVPAESGDYAIGLTLSAYGGTQSTQTLNVTVNNDGVTEGFVGFDQSFVGFIFARPNDWVSPFFIGEFPELIIRTESIDADINTTAYMWFDVALEDENGLQRTLDELVAMYGLNVTTAPQPMTTPTGSDVLVFDYTVRQNNRNYVGRGMVSYLDVPDIYPPGMIIGVEVVDPAALDDAYAVVWDSFVRYDRAEFGTADTSHWQQVETFEGVNHPMQNFDWELFPPTQDDPWYRWQNINDNVFFRVGEFIANPSRSRTEIRDTFFARYVDSQRTNISLLADDLTYTGAYASWAVIVYEADVNGVRVQGRFYLRLVNQRAYVLWFEAPTHTQGQQITENVLEVIVDGFRINEVPLERLGVLPTVVNLGPTNILAESNAEPELLLRYDARSLVLYNRLPDLGITLNGVEFRQAGEDGNLQYYVPVTAFPAGNVNHVRPQDCYQIWTNDYFNVAADEYPSDICNFRRGFLSTRNAFWISDEPGKTFTLTYHGEVIATCLTVRAVPASSYTTGNPDNIERQCLVDLRDE